MTRYELLMRKWLVPRRPNHGIFLWIMVPTTVALVLAMGITSGAASGKALDHSLAGLFLVLVGGLMALVISIATHLRLPKSVFGGSLYLAIIAAYSPHVVGAYLGVSLALWAGTYLPLGLGPLNTTDSLTLMVGFGLAWFLLGLLANHLAEAMDRRLAYERELAHQIKELETSRRRMVSAQEGLRKDIASHLHGGVQGRLWVVIHKLRRCSEVAGNSMNGLQPVLDEAIQELERVNGDVVREISHQLYSSIISRGLPAALVSLSDRFDSIPVALEIDDRIKQIESPDGLKLPHEMRLALYRVGEEALSNAAQHSNATQVRISLQLTAQDHVVLVVEDNGIGLESDEFSTGSGILSMEDNVRVIGGDCTVTSTPGQGTRITVQAELKYADNGATSGPEHPDAAYSPAPSDLRAGRPSVRQLGPPGPTGSTAATLHLASRPWWVALDQPTGHPPPQAWPCQCSRGQRAVGPILCLALRLSPR